MKKILFILFFISINQVSAVFGQDELTGRKTAEQRTEISIKNINEKLVLNDSQAKEISELILKREKLRDAGKLSDEKKKKIKADIHKILTPEQRKIWKNLKKENL